MEYTCCRNSGWAVNLNCAMRKWWIGCGVIVGLGAVLCCGGFVWLFRPPSIEIPAREYPPNNAYAQYRKLGEEMTERFRNDTRLKQIEDAIAKDAPLSTADRAYYLQQMEPYLRAYAPLTDKPCKAIVEYDPRYRLPELAQFRRLARAEMLLTREALRRQRYSEALDRIERVNRFADQVRTEGALIHYLVGMALNTIAFRPLREELPRLHNRAALERIVRIVQAYETRRVPLWTAIEQERLFILGTYDKLAKGEITLSDISEREPSPAPSSDYGVAAPLVNLAVPELNRLMNRMKQELQKPFHERDRAVFEQEPRQLLNAILYPVVSPSVRRELGEVAMVRLVGCAAAIRLYHQRTGKYPESLEALQLGEMIRDPFSGEPFRYRVDPKRGFLLYSVSENGVDDGGYVPYEGAPEERGDLSAVVVRPPESLRGVSRADRPLAPPVWMR